MMELKCLTTKEVARLCRVSDATIKRWEDAGLIKSERTNGKHRRFRAEEIARFQREKGLGLKASNGDESIIKTATRRRQHNFQSDSQMLHSLVAGCEEEVINIMIGAHLSGTPLTEIFDEQLCPAMRQIGDLWYNGDLAITQEHIATRVACNAIFKLRNVLPVTENSHGLVMCCSLEGDFHDLPTHLAQTVFENEGWEVINFGANTPLYSLAEEILHHSPQIICIAATVMTDVERLARDYKIFIEQIEKLKIPIILGGRVFNVEQIRRRFPADLHARSFEEIVQFTKQLSDK